MAGRAESRRRPKPALVLEVPSETAYLAVVRDLTRKMAETAGFDAATALNVALAVDEAASNVIEHAYHGRPGKRFEVRIDDNASEFRVEVIDAGDMVDPRTLPRVDLERYASERRTGGLGVHLMGKIMDSVTFRRSARKNVCCLVKRKA
jgi:anti-sigma regulatory factor (Ser/Thr protein kinase)